MIDVMENIKKLSAALDAETASLHPSGKLLLLGSQDSVFLKAIKRKADQLGINCDHTSNPLPPYRGIVVDSETVSFNSILDPDVDIDLGMKHIVCFSGGHSSAIAAVEVVRKFGAEDTILLNHDLCPRTEDADIKRFKKQVSDYLGVPITYANMPGWDVKDQFDVCMEIKAFKAGAQSTAFCTNRLKTEPFHKWLSEHYPANPPEVRDDISLVYGFDANEQHRIRRRVGIMAAMGYQTEYPLTWEVRTIHDIEEVGIERPKTYSIFNHANCTGCLKAGKQHWFVVYCLYPEIWEKAKLAEDTIGYSILKQGYLSDFETEFAKLKEKALPPTEKAKPQTFWAAARKLIKDDDDLPCECSF